MQYIYIVKLSIDYSAGNTITFYLRHALCVSFSMLDRFNLALTVHFPIRYATVLSAYLIFRNKFFSRTYGYRVAVCVGLAK